MTQTVTKQELEAKAIAVTDLLRALGKLHPESSLIVGGRYGNTYIDVTGGPYYGTGIETLISGTKRECAEGLWAIVRVLELGRRSLIAPIDVSELNRTGGGE